MREPDLEFLESRIDVLRRKEGGGRDGRKVEAAVFDGATLMSVYKLLSDRVLDTIEFPINAGKEAVVFAARTSAPPASLPEAGWLAVKIYRISNADFRKMWKYVDGDPRFDDVRRDLRSLIMAWAQKEYKNLMRAANAGARVPVPVAINRNVLVMELIADGENVAPMLKNTPPADAEAAGSFYRELVAGLRALYRGAGLVHSDMSEYNVLVSEGMPVIIDMGQSVLLQHPAAREFLERDVANVHRYFSRLGVDIRPEDVMEAIVGEQNDEDGPGREPADERGDPSARRPRVR